MFDHEISTSLKFLAIALAVVGCAPTEPRGPTAAELCARDDSLLRAEATVDPTLNGYYVVVARLLPGGFGGLTAGFIYLKDPSLAESARETARLLESCVPADQRFTWRMIQSVDVRQGAYDWVQLWTWYRALGFSQGMFTSDIDEALNKLSYTFDSQASIDAFRAHVQALGVPLDAVALSIGTPIAVHSRAVRSAEWGTSLTP